MSPPLPTVQGRNPSLGGGNPFRRASYFGSLLILEKTIERESGRKVFVRGASIASLSSVSSFASFVSFNPTDLPISP